MIKRKKYQEWLIKHRDNGLIKVISGVRRSGKSTLFELHKMHLLEAGVKKEKIIHINFEDLRYYDLRNFLSLHEHILDLTRNEGNYYIFLDEIQNVEKY